MTRPAEIRPLDRLLASIDAQVEAFAICEVSDGWRLRLGPLDQPILHFVLDGEGQLGGSGARLRPGTLAVVPAGQTHEVRGPGPSHHVHHGMAGCEVWPEGLLHVSAGAAPRLRTACATVTARYWQEFDLFSHLAGPAVIAPGGNDDLAGVFAEMAAELGQPRLGARAIASALLKKAFALAIRAQVENGGAADWLMAVEDPRIGRAVAAMLDMGGRRASVEDLAAVAGMSRSAFQRRFRALTGLAVSEFDSRLRLRRAAVLLAESDLPVARIAAMVGFASRSHFSRGFRAATGLDPSAFRRRHGAGRQPGALRAFVDQLLGG